MLTYSKRHILSERRVFLIKKEKLKKKGTQKTKKKNIKVKQNSYKKRETKHKQTERSVMNRNDKRQKNCFY